MLKESFISHLFDFMLDARTACRTVKFTKYRYDGRRNDMPYSHATSSLGFPITVLHNHSSNVHRFGVGK